MPLLLALPACEFSAPGGGPLLALHNAFPAVALFRVVGKLAQQFAGEIGAKPAVFQLLALAAGFHGAGVAPKGFGDGDTALAVHFFPGGAGAAPNAAS